MKLPCEELIVGGPTKTKLSKNRFFIFIGLPSLILLFVFLFQADSCCSDLDLEIDEKDYVWLDFSKIEELKQQLCSFCLISIPGSGTHCLTKTLFLMTGFSPRWHGSLRFEYGEIFDNYSEPNFLCTHFFISPVMEKLHELFDLKKIVCIRDLRDVCVSIVYKIREKGKWPGFADNPEKIADFHALSFDQQLLYVINYEYDPVQLKENWQVTLEIIAQQAIQYIQNSKALVVRYENLVGEKGNGTQSKQLKELKKIAKFLELENIDFENVANCLYGNEIEPTHFSGARFKDNIKNNFHNGKIGIWKAVFTEEHKAACKKKFGDALIALGYEQDNNW